MKRTAALLLTLALVLSVLTPGSAAEAKTVKKNFSMRVRELKHLTLSLIHI